MQLLSCIEQRAAPFVYRAMCTTTPIIWEGYNKAALQLENVNKKISSIWKKKYGHPVEMMYMTFFLWDSYPCRVMPLFLTHKYKESLCLKLHPQFLIYLNYCFKLFHMIFQIWKKIWRVEGSANTSMMFTLLLVAIATSHTFWRLLSFGKLKHKTNVLCYFIWDQ